MKMSYIRYAALAAISALIAAACTKALPGNTPEESRITEDGCFTVCFTGSMAGDSEVLEQSIGDTTKTAFHAKDSGDGETIWWSSGDKILFAQNAAVAGTETFKSASISLSTDKKTFSASISSFNTPDEGTEAVYYSVAPYSAYASRTTSGGVIYPRITLPAIQKPSLDGFDPAADILISDYVVSDAKETSLKLTYYRYGAIGKMTVKGLPEGTAARSVEFSAASAGYKVPLAGSALYDLREHTKSTQTSSSCTKEYTVQADYSALEQPVTGEFTSYIITYPFELKHADNASFTVAVKADDGYTYTKKVVIPEGRDLTFRSSHATRFSVDMSSAVRECPWCKLSPYSSTTRVTTISKTYAAVTNNKSGVDLTSVKYCYTDAASFASIGNIEEYIEANGTAFTDTEINNVNSGYAVVITVNGTFATEYVVMAKVSSSEGGVILTTTVKTADSEQLSAPVATASDITTGGFKLSWEAVTGASGYSCSINGGEPVLTTETSMSFSGLAKGTEYTVTIKAVTSAATPQYTDSEEASISVTTLSETQPSGGNEGLGRTDGEW